MKADAIFEGGGVRGIAFVGAISCLEDRGYEFERIAGTSAGAIMAALLAVGYTGKELSLLMDMDFSEFLDPDLIQSIPLLGKPLGLFTEKGLYQGDFMEEWMQGLLKKKGRTKFRNVMRDGESRLKIIASDITKKEILILPDDLPKYGIDPMEFEIAKAVRMSAGIPLFFNPTVIKSGKCKSYIVDGGLLSNFPVWIFDVDGTPRWPTFGFKLEDSSRRGCFEGRTDLLSYISDLFSAVADEDQTVFMRDKDSVRTISIPTPGIRSTDFDLTHMDAFKLYQSGYESCQRFLRHWNFSDYISHYRR